MDNTGYSGSGKKLLRGQKSPSKSGFDRKQRKMIDQKGNQPDSNQNSEYDEENPKPTPEGQDDRNRKISLGSLDDQNSLARQGIGVES